MAARRLWYSIASFAALLALLAVARADDVQKNNGVHVDKERLLTDFVILAIQPDGDERDYRMVEVGKTKIDAGPMGVVVNALPFDFFGLRKLKHDPAAELAQCWAACRKRTVCRDAIYEPANANRPVGVCRLRTYDAKAFGKMAPIVEAGDERKSRIPPKREPRRPLVRATAEIPAVAPPSVEPTTTRPPPPPKRPIRPHEVIPPPPRVPSITVEHFPLPPRQIVEAAAPPVVAEPVTPPPKEEAPPAEEPVVVEPPPAETVEPPVLETPTFGEPETPPVTEPVASRPPTSIFEPQPPPEAVVEAPIATPVQRERGLPLWVVIASVVAVLGGATLYWRNHRVRTLGRVTARLISDGLDDRTVRIVGAEQRGLDLRFVVKATAAIDAPGTHIELIPKGAAA